MTISAHSSRLIARIAIAVALLMASACSSNRQARHEGATPVSAQDAPALARSLAESARPWRTMTAPFSMRVKGSGLPKLSGTLSMAAGQSILLSIRFLGMEMGALYVDADSLKGYVKPQKMYIAESIPDLLGGFPATVSNLQSLLLGELFTFGLPEPSLNGAEISPVGSEAYTISPPSPAAGLDYGFGVRLPANTISAAVFTTASHSATVLYPEAGKVSITATMAGKKVEAELELNLGRAQIDDPSFTQRRPAIPAGYQRVRPSSLLKVLENI